MIASIRRMSNSKIGQAIMAAVLILILAGFALQDRSGIMGGAFGSGGSDLASVGGESTCLVDVPKWDFQWQQFYFYQSHTGIAVKPNSTLKLTCTWNNPTSNTVRWGESTDDEMCLAFLYVTGGL